MPADRTIAPDPSPPPAQRRTPDRLVGYAARGASQLGVVIAGIAGVMVGTQLLLYEVLGDRGDVAETALRGVVVSLIPIGLVVFLVREERRRR
ncbi:MAG TPA: hypothetical protein VNA12_05745 [Mycobacteriales bacterium]|nr:hypothetical protein [Mycobacteriales bacterium]